MYNLKGDGLTPKMHKPHKLRKRQPKEEVSKGYKLLVLVREIKMAKKCMIFMNK